MKKRNIKWKWKCKQYEMCTMATTTNKNTTEIMISKRLESTFKKYCGFKQE